MTLRDKYQRAIEIAKSFRMDGSAEEHDGKLYFRGTVQTQEQANKIWDAIKTVSHWRQEVVADIKALQPATAGQTPPPVTTYTVMPGDTLGEIAKRFLGDSGAYRDIFEVNRDQLSDPNKIHPGQVLKIPQVTHRER
jgi:nucleoid-associated protein YgaU